MKGKLLQRLRSIDGDVDENGDEDGDEDGDDGFVREHVTCPAETPK